MKTILKLLIILLGASTFLHSQSTDSRNRIEVGIGYILPSNLNTYQIAYHREMKTTQKFNLGIVATALKSNVYAFRSNRPLNSSQPNIFDHKISLIGIGPEISKQIYKTNRNQIQFSFSVPVMVQFLTISTSNIVFGERELIINNQTFNSSYQISTELHRKNRLIMAPSFGFEFSRRISSNNSLALVPEIKLVGYKRFDLNMGIMYIW